VLGLNGSISFSLNRSKRQLIRSRKQMAAGNIACDLFVTNPAPIFLKSDERRFIAAKELAAGRVGFSLT
jgi:hypothetical protein